MEFIRRLYNFIDILTEINVNFKDEDCNKELTSLKDDATGLSSYSRSSVALSGPSTQSTQGTERLENDEEDSESQQSDDSDALWNSEELRDLLVEYAYEIFGHVYGVRTHHIVRRGY